MSQGIIGDLTDIKNDIQGTTKEEFYSNAVKHRVQLLWLQRPITKLYLLIISVVCLGFTGCAAVFILLGAHLSLPVGPSDRLVFVTLAPLVGGIALAGVYAAGLLIYGWRIRRACRKMGTIIYRTELTLAPVEVAALIGKADYISESWSVIYRLIETGNLSVKRNVVTNKWQFHRHDNPRALSKLYWFEKEVLLAYFPTGEARLAQAQHHISPERFAALNIDRSTQPVDVDSCGLLTSGSYMYDLNIRIRARLIKEGVFRPLSTVGLWVQTYLMVLTFVMGTCMLFIVALTIDQFVRFGYEGAKEIIAIVKADPNGLSGFSSAVLSEMTVYDAIYVIAFFVLLVGSMFWFFATDIYTRFGLKKFIEAQGLLLYLEVALKTRLESEVLSDKELIRYLPYAEALGLVDVNAHDIDRKLQELSLAPAA